MAARPEIAGNSNYYPWATALKTELVVSEGKTVLVENKVEPLEEHTIYGLKYDEPPNFPEINYQFAGYTAWLEHLDGRYKPGDKHFTTTAESNEQISIRLGGTWEYQASFVAGSETIKVYEKIA